MEYLLNLGHRRIGFISGRPDLQSANRRLQGYHESLSQANLPINPDFIQPGDFTQEAGYRGAKNLLALPNPPTAIFAANDKTAIGAIEAVSEAGLHVPADVSVVGFDNVEEAIYCNGGLTTVDQSLDEMAQTAVKILLDLIQNKAVDNQLHRVPTKLIIRNSCRAIQPDH